MGPYRAILVVVSVLSFLSVAGMREIRMYLIMTIALVNVFGWTWLLIDKWNKQRNRHTSDGEQELQVGNYGEAEKSLALAATEAGRRGATAAKQAGILRSLAVAQRKQGKFSEAEKSIRQAMALVADSTGQGRSQCAECLEG